MRDTKEAGCRLLVYEERDGPESEEAEWKYECEGENESDCDHSSRRRIDGLDFVYLQAISICCERREGVVQWRADEKDEWEW